MIFLADNNQEWLRGIIDIEEIYKIIIDGKHFVRKDSFIAPAVIREIINEIHFLCLQDDTTPALDEELLGKYNSRQFIHRNLQSLVSCTPKGALFDIDLDIFNKSDYWGTGDLWTDSEILDFLWGCSGLIKSSPLITIAMSFNYSGSEDDTKFLTRFVVPRLLDLVQKK